MKKAMKIVYILLCVMIALSPILLATTIGGVTVTPNTTDNTVTNWGDRITGIIKIVGIFVAVGALMAIGIKYMMGSAEEKAEYKKVMIPYIIGAVLLLAASLAVNKIASLASELFN